MNLHPFLLGPHFYDILVKCCPYSSFSSPSRASLGSEIHLPRPFGLLPLGFESGTEILSAVPLPCQRSSSSAFLLQIFLVFDLPIPNLSVSIFSLVQAYRDITQATIFHLFINLAEFVLNLRFFCQWVNLYENNLLGLKLNSEIKIISNSRSSSL